MEKLIKIAILLTLVGGIVCDCPIVPYPRRTTLGYINAQLNNDPSLHNVPNDYSYTLDQQLTDSVINVAVGVVALEFNANERVDFNIQYLPGTSLTHLKFRVRANSDINGWRMLRFNFFASQSPLFQIATLAAGSFSVGGEKGKYALYRAIPNYANVQVEPVVRIFLSGVTIKSLPPDQQYDQMLRQFETFKKFSTSGALVRYFSQAIQIKKSLQLKISDMKTIGRLYSFAVQTNCQLLSLSYSFIIFSKKSYTEVHNYIADNFNFINSNEYRFTSLQNMDMVMTGIIGFKVPKEDYYSLGLGLNNLGGQSVFTVNTNYRYLDTSFGFVGFEMKTAFVCHQCTNSPFIYENKMCVERCPFGFSVITSANALFCDKCDIDKLKVVDTQSGQCVCAKRHFLEKATGSCKPCGYDCMTCDSSTRCLTCDNTMLQTRRVLAADGRCKCPAIGYYDDKNAEDIICQKCNPKCLTCNGPKAHDCLSCDLGKERDSTGFCVCKNGFVEDWSGNCLCPQPRKLTLNNICLDMATECRQDQVAQYIDVTKKCVCKPGYYTVLNDCIKCGISSVFNPETLKCQCQSPTVYKNGQCQPCGYNQVYDSILKICTCQDGTYERQDGSCITCPPKMILLNDNCECAFNYYEETPGICKRCRRETDGPKCKRNLY